MSGAMGRQWNIIAVIFYTNIAFYVLSILLNPQGIGISMNPMTFLSPSDSSLFILGATGSLPILVLQRWWTLISASFLHGSILHIFFNMAALRQLGPFVVREFGVSRFIILYILSGAFGFFLSALAGISFTIGASASLCGLIGAILYYGKSRGGYYGQAVYKEAMGWVMGLVIFGLFLPGINNWAHGGGIAAGALTGFIIGYEEKRKTTYILRILAAIFCVLTVLVLVWSVFQTFFTRLF
jgi:rhomboid protease GluP